MISVKDDVDLSQLVPEIWQAVPAVRKVYESLGVSCVITSGREGEHGKKSLHPKGKALDFRTNHTTAFTALQIARAVRVKLSGDFDVVLHVYAAKKRIYQDQGVWIYEGPKEVPHLHLEFDP